MTRTEQIHERAAENGEPCPLPLAGCSACIASAQDAGIPLAVILGEKRLSECFSEDTIAIMTNRQPKE